MEEIDVYNESPEKHASQIRSQTSNASAGSQSVRMPPMNADTDQILRHALRANESLCFLIDFD